MRTLIRQSVVYKYQWSHTGMRNFYFSHLVHKKIHAKRIVIEKRVNNLKEKTQMTSGHPPIVLIYLLEKENITSNRSNFACFLI